jgi:ligand-binding sensor domain-containing protein
VGTYDMGIYRSSNSGVSWQEKNNGLTKFDIYSLICKHNGYIFSGPDYGTVERSTDNGENWTDLNNILPAGGGYHVFTINSDGIIFVGHEIIYGVYRSVDNGDTWTAFNSGLSNKNIHSLAITNEGYIFAGTSDGVFRTVNPTTFIANNDNYPNKFGLKQNYPNPFNSETNIELYIPKKEFVELKIFDITGKEVENLISKNMNAGKYQYKWRATEFISSGIYYYHIKAGEFTQTKKMLLLK